MKIKEISVNDLDNYLSDGATICDILGDGVFEALRIKEWNETYTLNEDVRINQNMNSYRKALYIQESRKAMKESL